LRKRLLDSLRPRTSWLSLIGIVVFFFLPEIVAYFWGDRIERYFIHLAASETDEKLRKIYEMMEDFGEVSYLNVVLGLVFVGWFFYERGKSPED